MDFKCQGSVVGKVCVIFNPCQLQIRLKRSSYRIQKQPKGNFYCFAMLKIFLKTSITFEIRIRIQNDWLEIILVLLLKRKLPFFQ